MKENSQGCYHQLWRKQSNFQDIYHELATMALVSKESGKIAVHFRNGSQTLPFEDTVNKTHTSVISRQLAARENCHEYFWRLLCSIERVNLRIQTLWFNFYCQSYAEFAYLSNTKPHCCDLSRAKEKLLYPKQILDANHLTYPINSNANTEWIRHLFLIKTVLSETENKQRNPCHWLELKTVEATCAVC